MFTSAGQFWVHPTYNHSCQGLSTHAIWHWGYNLQRLHLLFLLCRLLLVPSRERIENKEGLPHGLMITAIPMPSLSIIFHHHHHHHGPLDIPVPTLVLSCIWNREDYFNTISVTKQLDKDQQMRVISVAWISDRTAAWLLFLLKCIFHSSIQKI